MLEVACTPPRPDGSVARGVFLGLVLDLFQVALFPSVLAGFGVLLNAIWLAPVLLRTHL